MLMENIREETITVKNGFNQITYTFSVDDSKPKCWVEDNQYKFNKTLIREEIEFGVYRHKEF